MSDPNSNFMSTDQANTDEVLNLMSNYETLIQQMQGEIGQFKEEQRVLKDRFNLIAEESAVKPDQLNKSFKENYFNVVNKIFKNLSNQSLLLQKDKEMFETLWKSSQKTVAVLEAEICDYREQLSRQPSSTIEQQYKKKIEQLEGNLEHTKKELLELVSVSTAQRIHQQEIEENWNHLVTKNEEIKTENVKLEELLEEANSLNREQVVKAAETLKKLEETIEVAEQSYYECQLAMQERDKLLLEKAEIDEEYNNLAKTIGETLENASIKVQQEISEIQNQSKLDICKLEQQLLSAQNQILDEKAKTEKCESIVNMKSAELIVMAETNKAELKLALRTVAETEEKLKILEEAILREQQTNKNCDLKLQRMQSIIKMNSQNCKEKYKTVFLDITKQLEEKVNNLILENFQLKTDLIALQQENS